VQPLGAILARERKLLEGRRARETSRWARARVRGGAGPCPATARRGGIERAGAGKKKERKEMVTDRWGRAEGMTEKERMTEKRTGMTEKRRND
jgi:hypothetical protein